MGVVDDAGKIAGKVRSKGEEVKYQTDMATRPAPVPVPQKPSPADRVNPKGKYGDKTPEQRIDVKDYLKPLGSMPSYKHGTGYVPKTGPAMLHEGEAVIPKEANTMDAKAAMAGIMGKSKPPKKIHKITTHKTDDGKMIHTHMHHHPQHHPDETHVSNNLQEAQDHMAAQEPNMSAQPPEMPQAGAPEAGAAGPMPGM